MVITNVHHNYRTNNGFKRVVRHHRYTVHKAEARDATVALQKQVHTLTAEAEKLDTELRLLKSLEVDRSKEHQALIEVKDEDIESKGQEICDLQEQLRRVNRTLQENAAARLREINAWADERSRFTAAQIDTEAKQTMALEETQRKHAAYLGSLETRLNTAESALETQKREHRSAIDKLRRHHAEARQRDERNAEAAQVTRDIDAKRQLSEFSRVRELKGKL